MNTVLPWHAAAWDKLKQRADQQQLPHALLITGPQGCGKQQFARAIADYVLCKDEQQRHLFNANTHPDLLTIQPPEGKKNILIEQIRQFLNGLYLTAQYGGYKVTLIRPAEAMNISAANSLLKGLEEPPQNNLLILQSNQPGKLLPTIRSRCQTIQLGLPDEMAAKAWLAEQGSWDERALSAALAYANHAPLAALEILQSDLLSQRNQWVGDVVKLSEQALNPITIASRWAEYGLSATLHWLQQWTSDLLRAQQGIMPNYWCHIDHQQAINTLAQRCQTEDILAYWQWLTSAIRAINSNANLLLTLEAALIPWATCLQVKPHYE